MRIHFIFDMDPLRIRIRGASSDDYGSGSGSGSEVTLALWILFSAQLSYTSYFYAKLYKIFLHVNSIFKDLFLIFNFSLCNSGQFWFFFGMVFVSFWRYPDPDPYHLNWIRIRLRPNELDPTGSGSGSATLLLVIALPGHNYMILTLLCLLKIFNNKWEKKETKPRTGFVLKNEAIWSLLFRDRSDKS